MSTIDSTDRIPKRRQHRLVLALVALMICCAVLVFWTQVIRPQLIHRGVYDRIENAIHKLARMRPPEVPQKRWNYMVLWTQQALGNCCSAQDFISDKERYHRFADELEERVTGPVTTDTIDWIWDEFEAFSRIGTRYSERFRPTTPEKLAEADQAPDWDLHIPEYWLHEQ